LERNSFFKSLFPLLSMCCVELYAILKKCSLMLIPIYIFIEQSNFYIKTIHSVFSYQENCNKDDHQRSRINLKGCLTVLRTVPSCTFCISIFHITRMNKSWNTKFVHVVLSSKLLKSSLYPPSLIVKKTNIIAAKMGEHL
jgi:hypothetical protein